MWAHVLLWSIVTDPKPPACEMKYYQDSLQQTDGMFISLTQNVIFILSSEEYERGCGLLMSLLIEKQANANAMVIFLPEDHEWFMTESEVRAGVLSV